MTRLLPCLLLLVALAAPAWASAADPIEGRWIYQGAAIDVGPAAGGGLRAVAVTPSPSNGCIVPGTEVWSGVSASGPTTYDGTVNLFSGPPCAPAATAASFSFPIPEYGDVCETGGGACETVTRPAQCSNGIDDDGDGDVDTADVGCDRAEDGSEAPDPVLGVTDQSAYEGAGSYAPVSVSLSQPAARPVTFTLTTVAGTATAGADFLPAAPTPVQIPAGMFSASVPVSIVADALPEPSETFTVQLHGVSGARLGRASATVTIYDAGGSRGGLEDERVRAPARRTTEREVDEPARGGQGTRAVCGLRPPNFPGRPTARKDGRQRCPKARPKARRARGGSGGVDRMTGNGRANALAGLGGNDTLRGLGGGDRLAGGRGNDNVWGGSGGDALDGGDGDDRMYGGAGSDWLVEEQYGDDRLDGGPGDDVIAGNNGVDRINGGPGDDIISGGSGPDTVNCGPGYDTLYWNLNSDRARSRNCERFLEEADIRQRSCGQGGTNAAEQVRGDSGRDTCRGRGGDDVLEGAGGSDRLYGGAGNDTLFGRKGSELMYGGAGNDVLEGGQGADRMYGGTGSDVLNGGFGRDRLSGGPGNDTLNAGFGDRGEIVDCGPGHDTYVYGPGDKPRNCEVTRR